MIMKFSRFGKNILAGFFIRPTVGGVFPSKVPGDAGLMAAAEKLLQNFNLPKNVILSAAKNLRFCQSSQRVSQWQSRTVAQA